MIATPGSDELMKEFRNLQNKVEYNSPKLTKSQIQALINSKLISTGDKIELIELHIGTRLMTEIVIKNNKNEKNIKEFISRFQFPTHEIIKNDEVKFLFIFRSLSIKRFFLRNLNNLTEFELGLLYGFHPMSIMAFIGIIKMKEPPYPRSKKAWEWYYSKVFSEEFYEEERKYYKNIWEKVKKFSPRLIEIAEEEFKSLPA